METIDRSSTSYSRSLSVISFLHAVWLFPSQTAGTCDVTKMPPLPLLKRHVSEPPTCSIWLLLYHKADI